MATGAMVLESVVSESDDVGHNKFVSSLAEDPIVSASKWLPINSLGVRSGIGALGMYGYRLNVAPTPSATSKASLGSDKSWFTIEGLAWNLVRDLMSLR